MSDTFAGLTRRINAFVHDRETSEELSHLIDESKDIGGDAADALIELALGDDFINEDYDSDDEVTELTVALEEDELLEDEEEDIEVSEEEIDAALDELGEGLDDGDEDLDESTNYALRTGEVLVL